MNSSSTKIFGKSLKSYLAVFALLAAVVILVFLSPSRNTSEKWLEISPEVLPENKQLVSGFLNPKIAFDYIVPATGSVDNVYKNIGAHVKRGDKILSINSSDAGVQYVEAEINYIKASDEFAFTSSGGGQLDLRNARIKYNSALSAMTRSKKSLTDSEKLYTEGVIARSEVDNARTEYQNSVENLELSEIEYLAYKEKNAGSATAISKKNKLSAERRLSNQKSVVAALDVRAQYDGILFPGKKPAGSEKSISLEVGRRVAQGEHLFTLVSQESLRLTAEVDFAFGQDLKIGDQVEILLGSLSDSLKYKSNSVFAKIDNISLKPRVSAVGDSSRGQLVLVEANLADNLMLPPYAQVMAYVIKPKSDKMYYKIPSELLVWDAGQATLSTLDQDGSVIVKKVDLMFIQSGFSWVNFQMASDNVEKIRIVSKK
jgi:multidrug resistance efflux pump